MCRLPHLHEVVDILSNSPTRGKLPQLTTSSRITHDLVKHVPPDKVRNRQIARPIRIRKRNAGPLARSYRVDAPQPLAGPLLPAAIQTGGARGAIRVVVCVLAQNILVCVQREARVAAQTVRRELCAPGSATRSRLGRRRGLKAAAAVAVGHGRGRGAAALEFGEWRDGGRLKGAEGVDGGGHFGRIVSVGECDAMRHRAAQAAVDETGGGS